MKSLTVDEVKAIYARESALTGMPEGFDARQSTRVYVHMELQARNEMPCSSITPQRIAAVADTLAKGERLVPLTDSEYIDQIEHQTAQITKEDRAEFSAKRRANHVDVINGDGTLQVRDAHHWVQKRHGMALWVETDRLIASALSKKAVS
jgi:hypothetical protein